VQFLIDTATDAPAELYRIGKFLTDNYATAPAEEQHAAASILGEKNPEPVDYASILKDATPSPSPVFTAPVSATIATAPPAIPLPPPPPVPGNTADDVEIETDDPSLTVSVTLPPPPIPAPPGVTMAPELDSKGVAWDSRIHAANRAKKIDGTWKQKRGLSGVSNANSVPEPVVPSAPPAATVAPPPPVSVQPASSTPSVSAGTNAQPVTFRDLMMKIAQATAAGKISTDQVNQILASIGLQPTEMSKLINNGPLIASVNAAIDECTK